MDEIKDDHRIASTGTSSTERAAIKHFKQALAFVSSSENRANPADATTAFLKKLDLAVKASYGFNAEFLQAIDQNTLNISAEQREDFIYTVLSFYADKHGSDDSVIKKINSGFLDVTINRLFPPGVKTPEPVASVEQKDTTRDQAGSMSQADFSTIFPTTQGRQPASSELSDRERREIIAAVNSLIREPAKKIMKSEAARNISTIIEKDIEDTTAGRILEDLGYDLEPGKTRKVKVWSGAVPGELSRPLPLSEVQNVFTDYRNGSIEYTEAMELLASVNDLHLNYAPLAKVANMDEASSERLINLLLNRNFDPASVASAHFDSDRKTFILAKALSLSSNSSMAARLAEDNNFATLVENLSKV